MYRGFRLTGFRSGPLRRALGKLAYDQQSSQILDELELMLNGTGVIDAADLEDAWFPEVSADVFISHSHADEQNALGLARWLRDEFGLAAFVDSAVWRHSDQLLLGLDRRFSRLKLKPGLFDYEASSRAASHVHMLLSVALTKMLDRAEAVIFLDTPNSIIAKSQVKGTTTYSPWLYHEIAMTRVLRRTRPERTFEEMVKSAEQVRIAGAGPRVRFEVPLDHFASLTPHALKTWRARCFGEKGAHTLDVLYGMYPEVG